MKTLHAAFVLSRILLGGIFMYTGLIHLSDIEGFTRAVAAYDLLPLWAVNVFAIILPWTEILAGLSIATGVLLRAGSLVTTLLLASFTLAISISLYRELDISCGCFTTSPAAEKISWKDLVRDVALLASSSFLFLHASLTGRNTLRSIPGKYSVPVLTVLLVSSAIAFHAYTRNPCERVTLDTIGIHKSFPTAAILSKRPVHGLCEVLLQTEKGKVSLYVGKSFLIAGEMFQENASITREGFVQLTSSTFHALRSELDQAVAVRYVPEGGIRHTLYMFSSPDCPHCHKTLEDILPLLDETRTTLNVLLVAGDSGRAKAVRAICLKMDLESYLFGDWVDASVSTVSACEDGEALLDKALALGSKLGVTSVPTIFTQDGFMFSGSDIQAVAGLLKD
ncbi:MAG TPA: MauE/DoxX family redox-associated membrane protein [Bacteroidales bacterium]|jgi:glutaredoxin|nr:MauE/DoxX family redox-associated membrane protein [Bacteroidales bacterium]